MHLRRVQCQQPESHSTCAPDILGLMAISLGYMNVFNMFYWAG